MSELIILFLQDKFLALKSIDFNNEWMIFDA